MVTTLITFIVVTSVFCIKFKHYSYAHTSSNMFYTTTQFCNFVVSEYRKFPKIAQQSKEKQIHTIGPRLGSSIVAVKKSRI